MKEQLEAPKVPEDRQGVLHGLADVQDHGHPHPFGPGELPLKDLSLHLSGRKVVVVVQPHLPKGQSAAVLRHLQQLLRKGLRVAGSLMRVNPDGSPGPAAFKTMGHPDRLTAVLQVTAHDQHPPHARGGGPLHQGLSVLSQLVGVRVAMGIDQHLASLQVLGSKAFSASMDARDSAKAA